MNNEHPFFSLIIPTYQRPERLAACIGAVSRIDYPRDRFEVIVVDDGSQNSMEPVLAPFREQIDLRLIKQSNAGPAAARNNGSGHARGTYLAFTDDDCAPDTGWLRALANRLEHVPDDLIGGHTVNALEDNPYDAATQELMSYLYHYYDSQEPGRPRFFASNNIAMPVRVFRQTGGFCTTFPLAAGEDREFCDRWIHSGYKLTYEPQARVSHAHGLSLSKFWRQHFNYGRGAYHFRKLRSQRDRASFRLERASFYTNLIRRPFANNSGIRALKLVALLVISQAATAAGVFFELIRQRRTGR